MKLLNPAESLLLHKPDDNMREIKYSHSVLILTSKSGTGSLLNMLYKSKHTDKTTGKTSVRGLL